MNNLHSGILSNVNNTTGLTSIQWTDILSAERRLVPLRQPYVGRGWGIRVGIEDSTAVVADENSNIIGYVQQPTYLMQDSEDDLNVALDEYPYRILEQGEICLQSKPNSVVYLTDVGDIILETAEGNSISINKEEDAIYQTSAQRYIACESGKNISGIIKRDIRSQKEREEDALFGLSAEFGLSQDYLLHIIGVNPEYGDTTLGLFDPSSGSEGSFNNESDMLNPALVEWKISVNEFADSNIGLNNVELTNEQKALGKMEQNQIASITVGTVVNDLGKTLRFDYGFNNGNIGRGSIWKYTGNDVGASSDFKFDINNLLHDVQDEKGTDYEWTVGKQSKVEDAIMFLARFHTKGTDTEGKQEDSNYAGSLWTLVIDKEGLTKLNIPAALNTDGEEGFREGRSLLANFCGSITTFIGREKCTEEYGLDKITGVDTNADFVCTNVFSDYGRKDRSLTLECEGNVEALLGADDNKGQSLMIEAAGSLSFYFGKELNKISEDLPLSESVCFASDRTDRSLTGRLAGNLELDIGMDSVQQQSIMVKTAGGNRFYFGKDKGNENSIDLETEGGFLVVVAASKSQYAIDVDADGKVKLVASGDIELESQGNINVTISGNTTIKTSGDTIVESSGSCKVKAPTVDIGNSPIGGIVTDKTHPVCFITGLPIIGSKTCSASS